MPEIEDKKRYPVRESASHSNADPVPENRRILTGRQTSAVSAASSNTLLRFTQPAAPPLPPRETSHGTVTGHAIRRLVLEQSYRAHVGHIGSALSVADILASLYGKVLTRAFGKDPERDRFVLSKGHAALALYAALHLKGWISESQLNRFCADGSLLGVHPEFEQCGVDFATGSLGQGLCMAVGAALAAKWEKSKRRVFVLLSDAECNEGSVWEAAMLANHHQLSNLVVIIDMNGQQALDYTNKVVELRPMGARWKAFGWDVCDVNGHDEDELAKVIQVLDARRGAPHVLLARTISGKGVSFMENQIQWHYLAMSPEQYMQAMLEVKSYEKSLC